MSLRIKFYQSGGIKFYMVLKDYPLSFVSLEKYDKSMQKRANRMHMPKSLTGYVVGWCQEHGWTDLFIEHYQYWAFPPGAVMPLPVPTDVFQDFQNHRPQGATSFYTLILLLSGVAAIGSWLQRSPMPLVFAFCISAMAVGLLDEQA
jgi:hypothetical protein